MASVTACAATYDSLPAPAASYGEKQEYELYLSLSVNGNILANAVPVKVNAGHYWVAARTDEGRDKANINGANLQRIIVNL